MGGPVTRFFDQEPFRRHARELVLHDVLDLWTAELNETFLYPRYLPNWHTTDLCWRAEMYPWDGADDFLPPLDQLQGVRARRLCPPKTDPEGDDWYPCKPGGLITLFRERRFVGPLRELALFDNATTKAWTAEQVGDWNKLFASWPVEHRPQTIEFTVSDDEDVKEPLTELLINTLSLSTLRLDIRVMQEELQDGAWAVPFLQRLGSQHGDRMRELHLYCDMDATSDHKTFLTAVRQFKQLRVCQLTGHWDWTAPEFTVREWVDALGPCHEMRLMAVNVSWHTATKEDLRDACRAWPMLEELDLGRHNTNPKAWELQQFCREHKALLRFSARLDLTDETLEDLDEWAEAARDIPWWYLSILVDGDGEEERYDPYHVRYSVEDLWGEDEEPSPKCAALAKWIRNAPKLHRLVIKAAKGRVLLLDEQILDAFSTGAPRVHFRRLTLEFSDCNWTRSTMLKWIDACPAVEWLDVRARFDVKEHTTGSSKSEALGWFLVCCCLSRMGRLRLLRVPELSSLVYGRHEMQTMIAETVHDDRRELCIQIGKERETLYRMPEELPKNTLPLVPRDIWIGL